MKTDDELTDILVPVLEGHGLNIVDCPKCALTAGAEFNPKGADFEKHIYTRDYVKEVVALVKERATFVADIWTIAPYLFISPKEFDAFGIKAGTWLDTKPADPRRQPDPRAKVYDDTLTAPFLAKDADKFWKDENPSLAKDAASFLAQSDLSLGSEAIAEALEEHIKANEWPMGKVMNCLRLSLTGAASGLGIGEIVSLIGKKELGERVEFAAQRLG